MRHNTTVQKIMQEAINEKRVKELSEKYGYEEVGRKLTAYGLLQYFMGSSLLKIESYRELGETSGTLGLVQVDYSELSKKAKEVPYEIYMELCRETYAKFNREKRRKVSKEYNKVIAAIDSTRVVAKNGKFEWAMYKEGQSGIKLHVSYMPETKMPLKVVPTEINVQDMERIEEFYDRHICLVADRGYINVRKMCEMDYTGQEFVIRIRNDMNILNKLPFDLPHDSGIYQDYLCTVSNDRAIKAKYRHHQFRTVSFMGSNGEKVVLCTNIIDLTADEIAEMYRLRWSIESFFKLMKQFLSLSNIFGSSKNAAFSQVIIAFITYICLFQLFIANPLFNSFLLFLRAVIHNSPCVLLNKL
jgi:hypothetical protein